MALGNDESATLEIEVDVQGFDEQMGQVEQRAERAAKAQTAAVNREQKKQAAAVAAGIVAWKKLFDFMEQGTGETAKGIARLNAQLAQLKIALATAVGEAPGMRALVQGLNQIADAAGHATRVVNTLGNAIGAIASGPLNIIGVGADIASGGEDQRREILRRMSAAASEMEGGDIAMAAESGANRQAGREDAARIMAEINANAQQQAARRAAEREANRVTGPNARNRGGGGGAGGMSAEEKESLVRAQADRFATEKAARERAIVELARIETDAAKDRNAQLDQINRERYESQRLMEKESIEKGIDLRADETKIWVQLETEKQAAIDATLSAMAMVESALMRGGPAAQAAARIAMAIQGAIYAQKAIGEAAEALAAAGRYDTWGTVQHGAAAVQFGIAAGMKFAGAVGGGGGHSRGTSPAGNFASPRSGDRGGGSQKVETTYIIKTSGDILDSDRALRKLARHMRDIDRRR